MVTVQLDKFCRQLQLEIITDAGGGVRPDLRQRQSARSAAERLFRLFFQGSDPGAGQERDQLPERGHGPKPAAGDSRALFGLDFPVLIVAATCRCLRI